MKAISLAYKLLFILSRLPAPIYISFRVTVSNDTYIWVLASTLDLSISKINKGLSVTYKLLLPCRKILFLAKVIANRAFPVTCLPPPIYIKFEVSNGIGALASALVPSAMEQNESHLSCL